MNSAYHLKLDDALQLAMVQLQRGNYTLARRCLAKALAISPHSEHVHALVSATFEQDGRDAHSGMKLDMLKAALRKLPESDLLWVAYFKALTQAIESMQNTATTDTRSSTEHLSDWQDLTEQARADIEARLPWLRLEHGAQLRAIVQLVGALSKTAKPTTGKAAPDEATPDEATAARHEQVTRQTSKTLANRFKGQLGFIQFDPNTKQLSGFAIRLDDQVRVSNTACELAIRTQTEQGRVMDGRLRADAPHPLLRAAEVSASIGGFTIQLPDYLPCVEVSFADGEPLIGSPVAAIKPMEMGSTDATRMEAASSDTAVDSTAAESSMAVANEVTFPSLTSGSEIHSSSALESAFVVLGDDDSDDQSPTTHADVSVLIPVFESREHSLACIQSVIDAKSHNKTTHDIVVLDDASHDAELIVALQHLAQNNSIRLVRRAANLGFIRNMNRGMAMEPGDSKATASASTAMPDVVWLNADTRLSGNWLDRLRAVAYADPKTASVTPWSNHGEAMSLSGFQVPSQMPEASEHEAIDRIVQTLNLPAQVLVTGCGFCFYVKRQAINEVGYLDETDLIDGYGEETDWCLRARALGWQHMGATNVFVSHAGGQSFGARKQQLARHNNRIIRERYPLADRIHDAFREHDPLQPLREMIGAELKAQGIELETPVESQTDGQEPTNGNPADLLDPALVVKLKQDLRLTQWTKATDRSEQTHQGGASIVVDDLQEREVVGAWLDFIRSSSIDRTQAIHAPADPSAPTGDRHRSKQDDASEPPTLPNLFILQDTPGSHLLEKTGVAMRIGCPAGLSWSQWLDLLGVSHQASVAVERKPTSKSNPQSRRGATTDIRSNARNRKTGTHHLGVVA